jgi:CRISP-associated protein Cas1
MSHHIVHLLSPNLRVRLERNQLRIKDKENGTDRSVPLEDVAAIIAASPNLDITAAALRRMAELNVVLLICDEKFQPACFTVPYFRPTSTALLRNQMAWTEEWKQRIWRQIVAAKVRNQAAALAHRKRAYRLLAGIADRCANPQSNQNTSLKISVASVTASKRAALLSDSPEACESRAARYYWKYVLPELGGLDLRRQPGTGEGVNGMLDYGYAVMRTACLRSLAAHGFIAAIGVHHASKAGSFALADDVMEPLRPWVDCALRQFLDSAEESFRAWAATAAALLLAEIRYENRNVRLLNTIDLYIQSLAGATLSGKAAALRIPLMS